MNDRWKKPHKSAVLIMCFVVGAIIISACPVPPPMRYDFTPPPIEWVPERSEDGALLFRREDAAMGIMVNTECDRYQNVPLNPLSRTLFIVFENRKEIGRGEAQVDGHEAIWVIMECTLDDVPLKIKAYVFKAGGCIYDIVYFSFPEDYDEGLPYFENFVLNFRAEG